MTNANETRAARLAWDFNREVVIHLDRKALARLTSHARAEMDLFICDALHAPAMFGPRTFIVFREAEFNQFEVSGEMVSAEIDDAAWSTVVRYLQNASAVSALND